MEVWVPGHGMRTIEEVSEKAQQTAKLRYKRRTMRGNRLLKQAQDDGDPKRVKHWEKYLANTEKEYEQATGGEADKKKVGKKKAGQGSGGSSGGGGAPPPSEKAKKIAKAKKAKKDKESQKGAEGGSGGSGGSGGGESEPETQEPESGDSGDEQGSVFSAFMQGFEKGSAAADKFKELPKDAKKFFADTQYRREVVKSAAEKFGQAGSKFSGELKKSTSPKVKAALRKGSGAVGLSGEDREALEDEGAKATKRVGMDLLKKLHPKLVAGKGREAMEALLGSVGKKAAARAATEGWIRRGALTEQEDGALQDKWGANMAKAVASEVESLADASEEDMQKMFAQTQAAEPEKEKDSDQDGVSDDSTLSPQGKPVPLAGQQLQTRMRRLINKLKQKYGIPRTGKDAKVPPTPAKPVVGVPEALTREIRGLDEILGRRHWSLSEEE